MSTDRQRGSVASVFQNLHKAAIEKNGSPDQLSFHAGLEWTRWLDWSGHAGWTRWTRWARVSSFELTLSIK